MTEPQKFSRYNIDREVARGGMATLYLAHDPNFNRRVAIKVLPGQFTHDPQFMARFRREAQTIASLEHPAIVPVYDFGEENNQPFLVMRFMRGGTLADQLKAKGRLSPAECGRILQQVAPALTLAHEEGIVHRDLKPANILFDRHGNAYISDFGIAKLAEATANFTGSAIIGTPAYMSPEQVKGDATVDGRSDVYSLGVMLYEMLTGEQPYKADTPTKQLMKHVLEPVPDIRQVMPELSPAAAAVVTRALAKDRDERFPTPIDMAQAMTKATGQEPTVTAAVVPSPIVDEPDAAAPVDFDQTVVQPVDQLPTAVRVDPTPPPPAITPTPQPLNAEKSWRDRLTRRNIFIGVGALAFLCVFLMIAGSLGNENGQANSNDGTPFLGDGGAIAAAGDEKPDADEPATPIGRERPIEEAGAPTPIVTDTPGPRPTRLPTFTPRPTMVSSDGGGSATSGGSVGGVSGGGGNNTGGGGAPGGRVNPFNRPGDFLTEFPIPEPLPPGAGTFAVPKAGTWTSTDFGGEVNCEGRTFPLTVGPASSGTVTPSEDGRLLRVRGMGEGGGGSIDMVADPDVVGRYSGVLPVVEEGIEINFVYTLQLVTDEYIIGYTSAEFSSEGTSCTMHRGLDLVFSGS